MATAELSDFLRRLTRGMAAETLSDNSDRQLVGRALAAPDEAAFQAIVHRHGLMVYRVCWRVLQHPQDAEDAFQATFLILAQKLHKVRKHASLASWLHGVAHRVALKGKALSAARRRREHQKSVPDALPPDDVTWRELRSVLDAELSKLPDKWRLPLILCYLEGRTQDESASQLEWSKSTLRRRLEEARAALGCRLKRRGIVWSAALSALLLSDCMVSAAPAPGLVAATVEAAAGVAAGTTVAAVASVKVATLTEGVMKAMFLSKVKTALVVLVTVFGLGTGVGLMTGVSGNAVEAQEDKAKPPTTEAARLRVKELIQQLDAVEFDKRPDLSGTQVQVVPETRKPDDAQKKTDQSTPDVRILKGHSSGVYFAYFSPNGETLVTGAKGFFKKLAAPREDEVILWDVTAQRAKHKIQFTDPVDMWCLTLSADGKTLAVGTNVGIELRDAETGKTKHMLKGPWALSTGPCSLAFSPNSKTLAAGGSARDHIVRLWDVQTGELTGTLKGHGDEVAGLIFSPDGKTLASTGGMNDTTIRFWEVATGKLRLTVNKAKEESKDGTEAVDGNWQSWPMAFSPDGKILARGRGAEVKFWDARTGEVKDRVIEAHPGNRLVQSLAFSPDGKLVAGGRDSGEIDVWETRPADGKNDWRIGDLKQTLKEHSRPVMALAFSSSGEFLASGDQGGGVRVSKVTKK